MACSRCGFESHTARNCFAKRTANGQQLRGGNTYPKKRYTKKRYNKPYRKSYNNRYSRY